MPIPPRLRFRTKIWAVLCGFVFAALAVALVVAQDATLSRARDESRAALRPHARRLLRAPAPARGAARGRDRRGDAHEPAAAHDPLDRVASRRPISASGSAPTNDALRDANLRLQSALPSLALHERQVIFAVASAEGQLLYSKADPERYGQDLSAMELVRRVADQGRGAALWLDTEARVSGARLAPAYPSPALYLVRGEPVVFDDEVHGLVIAGEPIDRALLSSLRAISGVELALLAGPRVLATTLSEADAARLREKIGAFGTPALAGAGGEIAEVTLGDERYLALRAEIVPGLPAAQASFLLLSSLDAELAGFRESAADADRCRGGDPRGGARHRLRARARHHAADRDARARGAAGSARATSTSRVEIATGDELEELGGAFNEMAAGLRERELIKRTLERYVSKHVATELLREPGKAALAGVRRELTVLFVDLAGFTRLAEELAPEAVVAHLNEYFEAVCGAVLEQRTAP